MHSGCEVIVLLPVLRQLQVSHLVSGCLPSSAGPVRLGRPERRGDGSDVTQVTHVTCDMSHSFGSGSLEGLVTACYTHLGMWFHRTCRDRGFQTPLVLLFKMWTQFASIKIKKTQFASDTIMLGESFGSVCRRGKVEGANL